MAGHIFRKLKQAYYRRRAKKFIGIIENGYNALHLLLKKANYTRAERRQIMKDVIKNRSLLDEYIQKK